MSDKEALRDCPVDEEGDLEAPNNIFTCLESEECCTKDLEPACCATKDVSDELLAFYYFLLLVLKHCIYYLLAFMTLYIG